MARHSFNALKLGLSYAVQKFIFSIEISYHAMGVGGDDIDYANVIVIVAIRRWCSRY